MANLSPLDRNYVVDYIVHLRLPHILFGNILSQCVRLSGLTVITKRQVREAEQEVEKGTGPASLPTIHSPGDVAIGVIERRPLLIFFERWLVPLGGWVIVYIHN